MEKTKKFKLHILGVGNLFTHDMTNTSFLIENVSSESSHLYHTLIDCGYNVFSKLLNTHKELINNIDTVLITHNHPDHIGSLGALIFYRYFTYGSLTRIVTGEKNLMPLSGILTHMMGKIPELNAINSLPLNDITPYELTYESDGLTRDEFQFFPVKHLGIPAYGIYHDISKTCFTGDTTMLNPQFDLFHRARRIFHDMSEVYAPAAHANILDIEHYYPDEIKNKLHFVHHGMDFKPDNQIMYNNVIKFACENQVIDI